jgi:hypothetical protein
MLLQRDPAKRCSCPISSHASFLPPLQLSLLAAVWTVCNPTSLSLIRQLSRWSLKQNKMSTFVRCENEADTSTHQQTTGDDDEREATELGPVQHGLSDTVVNPASIGRTSASNAAEPTPILGGLRSWWKHYIQLHVPHADCRDHLGMFDFDPILCHRLSWEKAEQAQLTFLCNKCSQRTYFSRVPTHIACSLYAGNRHRSALQSSTIGRPSTRSYIWLSYSRKTSSWSFSECCYCCDSYWWSSVLAAADEYG